MAIDMSGKRIALTHIIYDKAAEMIGVWVVPDGNRWKLVSYLKSTAVEWGGRSAKATLLGRKHAQPFTQISLQSLNTHYQLVI